MVRVTSIEERMLRLLDEAAPSLDAVGYTDLASPKEPLADYPVTSFSDEWRFIPLAPPPPNTSEAAQEELEEIEGYLAPGGQYERHREDIERQDAAEADPLDTSKPGVIEAEFWNLLGPVPKALKAEVARLTNEVTSIGTHYKRRFNRVRPAQLAALKGMRLAVPPAQTAHSPAYPSNHALIGAFLSLYLAEKYPAHAEALAKLGRTIGNNRVYAGYHFPSDNMAGRQLAKALWRLLKRR